MSNVESLRDQVAGILTRHEVPFSSREDGFEFGVYRGSAAVLINFNESGGVPVVNLGSPVLVDIELEGDTIPKAHLMVNQLNCDSYFARFCLYANDGVGTIRLEHDLLGTDLQGSELMSALDHISGMADRLDDALQQELGGKHFEGMMEERSGAIDT